MRRQQGGPNRGPRLNRTVLVACVEGEMHDMAARIATDLLDSYGFDTVYLGANCPTDQLVPKIRSAHADALALSVTMTFHVATALRTVERLRSELGPDFPIIIGGEAAIAIPHDASFAGAIVSRGTGADLAKRLRSLLGVDDENA